MTTRELMLVPTASTSAANMAAVDMLGRYKSIYGLTWGIASEVSSPMGRCLSNSFGPQFILYGAILMELLEVVFFCS